MTDLIERAKEARERADYDGKFNPNMKALGVLLGDLIAALEAPLPDDVKQKIIWLRQEAIRICDISPNIDSPNETQEWQLADTLERLARDRDAMDEERVNNYKIAQECEQENFELRQRIEELKDAHQVVCSACEAHQVENKRLDAALAKVESYAEDLKNPTVNHHEIAQHIVNIIDKARVGK